MDSNDQNKLFNEFQPVSTKAWEEKIFSDLKGADYEKKLIWKTEEGFDVKPYYRSEDLNGLEYLNALPSTAPYVRGVKKDNNDWIIRQDFFTKDINEANILAKEAISKGVMAIGVDATGISTHRQIKSLLEGINCASTSVNFISSPSYPLTLELFIYEIMSRGNDGSAIPGSINFDPISYLMLHGDFYVNWMHNLEEAEYLLNTIRKKLPQFKAITINGHYFQNAGSSLVQEVAFSLASANEYLTGMTAKEYSVDVIAPYICFSLGIGSNYFMEIAKLRAVRLLWSRMIDKYLPQKEESLRLFINSTTASWNKTIYDPWVNMLRTTTESMSAAIGNADSITVLPFDHSYKYPDEISRRMARNQQLVLKEESYLDKVVDPAAGSYYIENLTHSVVQNAWQLFLEVEERGGFIECFKSGFIQDKIEKSRILKEEAIEQRRIILLGTNQYPNLLETMADQVRLPLKPDVTDPSTYRKLIPFRGAAAFEEIRLATENFVAKGNKRPGVFLFTMGNLAMLRARAEFTTNFFGCAGYEIFDNQGFSTIDEGVAAALESLAEIVVICSSDEEYPGIVPEIIQKIKNASSFQRIFVAGYPKNLVESFKAAGVDDFIHLKANLLEILIESQKQLGIY